MQLSPLLPASLCIAASAVAQTDLRVDVEVNYYGPETTVTLSSETPLIAPDLVGTAVAEGMLDVTPKLDGEGIWLSTTQLRLTFKQGVMHRMPYRVTLRTEQGTQHALFRSNQHLHFEQLTRNDASISDPTLLHQINSNDSWTPFVESAMEKAYYRVTNKRDPKQAARTIPARARKLTVGDTILFKEILQANCYHGRPLSMTESEWDIFSKLPADQIVPDYWIIAPYIPPTSEQQTEVALIIPEAGNGRRKGGELFDWQHRHADTSKAGYSLSSEHVGAQRYTIRLRFTRPIPLPRDWDELLSSIQWTQRGDERKNQEESPLRAMGQHRYVSSPSTGDGMELRFDEKATRAGSCFLLRPSGEHIEVVDELVFELQKGIDPASLAVQARVESLVGSIHTPLASDEGYTELTPESASIASASGIFSMPRKGVAPLLVQYTRLVDPQLRVLRFEPRGAAAVRLIRAYEDYNVAYRLHKQLLLEHYAPKASPLLRDIFDVERKQSSLAARYFQHAPTIVPVDLFSPVEQRVIPLSAATPEPLVISLSDPQLYPSRPAGLYFVELSGEQLPELRHHAKTASGKDEASRPEVLQSIIQLSDLGLLWKRDAHGKQLFVYGYQLSTGERLEQPHLSLYSHDAQLLHEQAISPEGSILSLPDILKGRENQLAYLQLSTPSDTYTARLLPLSNESTSFSENYHFLENNSAAQQPTMLHEIITDRPIYRPGETAHIKGYVRWEKNNKLFLKPRGEAKYIEVTVSRHRESTSRQSGFGYDMFDSLLIPLESDGSFSFDFPIDPDEEKVAPYYIDCTVISDENTRTSSSSGEPRLASAQRFSFKINVEHFRRNEFELRCATALSEDAQHVRITAEAQQLSGAPLAGAEAGVSIDTIPYYPIYKDADDYLFGDHQNGRYNRQTIHTQRVKLDNKGKLALTLARPHPASPHSQTVRASVQLANGNEQALTSQSWLILHAADIYLGLRKLPASDRQSDQYLTLDLLAIDTAGKPCQPPHPITVRVEHRAKAPYKESSILHRMQPLAPSKPQQLSTQTITLNASGKGRLSLPLTQPGLYTITAESRDAQGRSTRTVIEHEISDREEDQQQTSYQSLYLTADRSLYQSGDTARLRLHPPIEGELLITMEREGILRSWLCSVTREQPFVDIPLQAEDSPSVTVTATHIHGAQETPSGQPVIIEGNTSLSIDPSEQRLTVTLHTPGHASRPGETLSLSGQIRDAQDMPAPHASVTLYAVDEGTLQAGNYATPNPLRSFYQHRPHRVSRFSSLGQFLTSDHHRSSGFRAANLQDVDALWCSSESGGLGSGDSGGIIDKIAVPLRENFTPTALWLAQLKTDTEGRFHATVRNPDTLTRYRVIAVASQGVDQFGVGTTSYQVTKPVMLEPSAPLSACEGDTVDIPVTLSMSPKDLPEHLKANKAVQWKLQLTGSEQVQVEQPEQIVTLTGETPQTVSVAVKMQQTGSAQLSWRITPVDATPAQVTRTSDGVVSRFPIRPATPYLRDRRLIPLSAGAQIDATQWLPTGYDPEQSRVSLTLSPSPLSGYLTIAQMLRDYPYDCTEQLASRCLPLLHAQAFHQAVGTALPDEKLRRAQLQQLLSSITQRRVNDVYYSYWADELGATRFSAYIHLILCKAAAQGLLDRTEADQLDLASELIKRDLLTLSSAKKTQASVRSNSLWIYSLAHQQHLSPHELDRIVQQQRELWTHPQQRWLIALAAQMIDSPRAAEYRELAQLSEAQSSAPSLYELPSMETIKLLADIQSDARALPTAEKVQAYMRHQSEELYSSTYQNAWVSILLADYIKHAGLQDTRGLVNGQSVTAAAPLRLLKKRLSELPTISVSPQSSTIYATSTAEGYQKDVQPEQLIDKGFHIQRSYERWQSDGTWQPTTSLRVGDIVRVSISAEARQESHHVVLEDYLPAGMEAVNPAITGQALPMAIMSAQASSWYSPAWMSRREFLKDRVRFFMTSWRASDRFRASYIARVTKAGTIKAPAAKAEEMYRPQIHGLALPQQLKVSPRE